jgi:hypothetical protein
MMMDKCIVLITHPLLKERRIPPDSWAHFADLLDTWGVTRIGDRLDLTHKLLEHGRIKIGLNVQYNTVAWEFQKFRAKLTNTERAWWQMSDETPLGLD